MGKIITLDLSVVLPGEDGFCPGQISSILKAVNEGNQLLPVPCRETRPSRGKYHHLDGRHRLIYRKMQGLETAEFYLAYNREDLMYNRDFPGFSTQELLENNNHIEKRWDTVVGVHQRIGVENFNEYFALLVSKFPYMRDIASFEKYVQANPSIVNRWCASLKHMPYTG
ncbi:hypothetical protein KA107_01400, partial [Candidatus Pacearchaeota archaeon]|nr:hypothetical protein [Candidatus Pacearchaeota archaeon]